MTKLKYLLILLSFACLPVWAAQTNEKASHYVAIKTNLGKIVVALYADKAPKTVENFLQYVDSGFYRNTIFHRVISGFMIQGGGYDAKFTRKNTRAPIINEATNRLKNLKGTIAMARTFDPHSATAQFFINLVDNSFLDHRLPTPADYGYTVFGTVVAGMEVVEQISQLQTGPGGPFSKDVPLSLVSIEDIYLTTAPVPAAATSKQR